MGSYTKHFRGPVGFGTRAAVYLRMSTDHQRYSIASQTETLAAYAFDHRLPIVQAYVDEGKSGVRIKGRMGLQALIADAQAPDCPFDVVLILDVSRWGRFQNADESAHYEFLCWQAGVALIYCGEAFDNDGSPMSSILKGMNRVMAAEYSRDLSRRITAGKLMAARRGSHAGGPVAYGLRRFLVDDSGVTRHELAPGERKAFATDAIRIAPGPPNEINVVRRIFKYFGDDGRSIRWIYEKLNAEGIPSPYGSRWCQQTLRHVLSNESYLGVQIYNRSNFVMKERHVSRPPEEHVRVPGIFPPLVSPELFARASARNQLRERPIPKPELIACLRDLHSRHGSLSIKIINSDPRAPGHQTFISRFGSMLEAYKAAGLESTTDHRLYFFREQIRALASGLRISLIDALHRSGHRTYAGYEDVLVVDDAFRVGFRIGLQHARIGGEPFWQFTITPTTELVLVTCLNSTSDGISSHFLFLAETLRCGRVALDVKNDPVTELHRLRTVDGFADLAKRLLAGEVTQPVGRIGRKRGTRWRDISTSAGNR